MDVVFAKVRQVHWTHITTTTRKNLLCDDVSLLETTRRVNMDGFWNKDGFGITLHSPNP
jgi:hypothetical protein